MSYQITTLSNGITVISESVDSVHSVSLGIWFQVGSRDELAHEAGLSHFNEHMMFKGTPLHSALSLSEQFDRYGAQQNAFTSKENTCYFANFIDESLPQVFELISDMVQNALFEQSACELEREVVTEEIARSDDDPQDRAYELFARSILPKHNLGLPIAGTKESVATFDSKLAKKYHDKHYHTSNCVVTAAGNLKHEELVALAEKYLTNLKVTDKSNASLRGAPSSYASGRFFETMPIEQAHIVIGTPSLSRKDEDRYKVAVTNHILGGSMSSRLFQEVREKQGLVYTVYSGNQLYSDSGNFLIYAGTRSENIEKVVATSLRELEKMAGGDTRKDELEIAQSAIRGALTLSLESMSGRMRRLGESFLAGAPILSFEESSELYKAVTLDDVTESAAKLFEADKVIAIVGPKG